MSPSTWMPDSWVNTASPTMLLLSATLRPDARATRADRAGRCLGSIPVSMLYKCRSAITASSNGALPARSPQAVDRGVDVSGTGQHRGQRIGRAQSEVVMRMHFDLDIHGGAQSAYALSGAQWVEHAQSVGKPEAPRSRPGRRLGRFDQEVRIRTRGVFSANRHFAPGIQGVLDTALNAL